MQNVNQSQSKDLVFGSYNRKDDEIVQAIKRRLRDHGIDLWLDTEKLLAGREWMTDVENAISRSRAAVIFKGPYGFGSFQREEVSALFKLHADKELIVIPALLPGASGKNAGLFLGNIQHVDFRLRNPDPLTQLVAGLAVNVAVKLLAQPGRYEPEAAHPLVKWIVNEMDSLEEIGSFGHLYKVARRWPEALYIYHRLASLAIRGSSRGYAESYLQIGEIYFLAGERDQAEKKWEIGLRVYQDYYPAELPRVESRLNALRHKAAAAYSPSG